MICAVCHHPAEDHAIGICLHTLECLCTGYVPQEHTEDVEDFPRLSFGNPDASWEEADASDSDAQDATP